jgi:hypothetical protein
LENRNSWLCQSKRNPSSTQIIPFPEFIERRQAFQPTAGLLLFYNSGVPSYHTHLLAISKSSNLSPPPPELERTVYLLRCVGAASSTSAGRLPTQSFPDLEHYTDFYASSQAPSSSAFPARTRDSFRRTAHSFSPSSPRTISTVQPHITSLPRPSTRKLSRNSQSLASQIAGPDAGPIDRDV